MTAVAIAKIRAVIESLDRICPPCLAATDQATWDLLHRGKVCRTRRA